MVSKRVIHSMARMRYRFETPQTVQLFDELDDKLEKINGINKNRRVAKRRYYAGHRKMDDAVMASHSLDATKIDYYDVLSAEIDNASAETGACNRQLAALWNACAVLVEKIESTDMQYKNSKLRMQKATIRG